MENERTVQLEKFELSAIKRLDAKLLDMAGERTVNIEAMADFVADEIAVHVTQAVYGEDLGTLAIKTPQTWWDMWKEQHAPQWLLRRWPVWYETKVYRARALYPRVSLPRMSYNTIWIKEYEERRARWL